MLVQLVQPGSMIHEDEPSQREPLIVPDALQPGDLYQHCTNALNGKRSEQAVPYVPYGSTCPTVFALLMQQPALRARRAQFFRASKDFNTNLCDVMIQFSKYTGTP